MAIITPQIHLSDGKVTTTTREIADYFGKLHKNVVRKLESLDCSLSFNQLNFEPVKYLDQKGEERTEYNVTKDGFTFLAMGFTGKKAAEFKEKYIAEFNRMESQLKKQQDAFSRLPMLSDQDRAKLKTAANAFIDLFGGVKTQKDASMLVAYIKRSVDEYTSTAGREALMGFRLSELTGFQTDRQLAVCQRDHEYFVKTVSPDDLAWIKTKLSWMN